MGRLSVSALFRLPRPRNDEDLALPLRPYFSRTIDKVAADFLAMKDIDDLARVLEVPKGNLVYIAYTRGLSAQYKTFEIRKKSGGTRIIHMPKGGLRVLQQKLKKIFDFLDRKPKCSHAYHKGKSFLTNAVEHKKKRFVFNMDLEEFFPSIHFGRVQGVLRAAYKMPPSVATFIAHLCCYNGSIPQGAPTSPSISNLVSNNLDKKILALAIKHHVSYTRYADDITFSYRYRNFPPAIGHFAATGQLFGPAAVGATLEQLIKDQGFQVNHKKTRLQYNHYQQSVTGVIVNQFPNVRRRKVLEVRKLIYLWRTFGLEKAETFRFEKAEGGDYFRVVLFGNLAYLKGVRGENDKIVRSFCRDILRITTKVPNWVRVAAEEFQVKDVFLSHASEDKVAVAKPLFDACQAVGISVFYDAEDIQWGDSVIEKINHGLGEAKIIVPVISETFLEKKWPVRELNVALSRFMKDKDRILPIIYNIDHLDDYPLLSDFHYKKWEDNPAELVALLKERLNSI